MVGELFAGIGAFKTMFDIAKAMKDMDDTVRRNAAIAELGEQIIAAQTRYAAAIEEIGSLKEKLGRLETWNTEKQKYELKDLGGVFAYALKTEAQGSEPPHYICASCYENGNKSILQVVPGNNARTALGIRPVRRCPVCKSEVAF
jgi:rubrerythrin